MLLKNLAVIPILIFLTACGNHSSHNNGSSAVDTAQKTTVAISTCKPGEKLLYGTATFRSFTEDTMRGQGVVSFQLDINDRLDILYLDDAPYCNVVYNEDGTFYTLDLPQKVTARALVPEGDMAQFDFDARADTDSVYLFIYLNGKKFKVKKDQVKYTFQIWDEYFKMQHLQLKACNTLPKDQGQVYEVSATRGDSAEISAVSGCSAEDTDFKPLKGSVRWRKDSVLLVDLASCN